MKFIASVFCIGVSMTPTSGHAAQADLTVSVATVYKSKLLKIDPITSGISVPTIKFFTGDGRLTGVSVGKIDENLSIEKAANTIPSGIAKKLLNEELHAVGSNSKVKANKTIIIYVMNNGCDVCDKLIDATKARVKGSFWQDADFLVVDIDV